MGPLKLCSHLRSKTDIVMLFGVIIYILKRNDGQQSYLTCTSTTPGDIMHKYRKCRVTNIYMCVYVYIFMHLIGLIYYGCALDYCCMDYCY